ncbi:hypothetical protein [Salinibacter ruber]|jgi:hypothetical protein|nr:hypothetical protein [Salinibacter ruber]
MGKYIILIVFAAAAGLAALGAESNSSAQDSSAERSERQGVVLARQIARSVFNDGVSEVQRTFDTVGDKVEEGTHEQGTYRLQLDAASTTGGKTVDLTAEGTYGEHTYQIQATVRKDTTVSSVFNAVTASTPVNFSVQGGGCSGGPCVSGLDAGGRTDRHGITLPHGEDAEAVCDEFHGGGYDSSTATNVEGTSGGCDVQVRTSAHDDWVENQMDQMSQTIQDAIADGNPDVTECTGCDLKNFSDSQNDGILYVTNGEFTVSGDRQWNGLVFVANGGTIRFNGGGDSRNINGGLVLQDWATYEQKNKDDEFSMNGGNAVQFNSDQLLKYIDTLPSIESTTTVVTDRTSRLLQKGE